LANSFRLCRTAGGISEVSEGRGGKVEDLPAEGEAALTVVFLYLSTKQFV